MIYFISDIHLGAGYIADRRAHERRVVSWLDSIAADATRLYLLGDVMDYWWDYRTVVPRGCVRFLGALARLADAGVEIVWLKGNHDIWLFDYMQREIGVTVVDGALTVELDGKKFFLEHGDGVGRCSRGFRFIRSMFRNRMLQKLYGAIHPRWSIALAHAWSGHSRVNDGAAAMTDDEVCSPLVDFARRYHAGNPDIDYFVFGHVHRVYDCEIAPGCRVVVLGDWIDKFSFARWDGKKLTLHRYTV